MKQLPKRFKKFKKDFPEVAKAYEELGTAVHKSVPLNEKTRALVKLAISTGAGMEGAVHSHTRKQWKLAAVKQKLNKLPCLHFRPLAFQQQWL